MPIIVLSWAIRSLLMQILLNLEAKKSGTPRHATTLFPAESPDKTLDVAHLREFHKEMHVFQLIQIHISTQWLK